MSLCQFILVIIACNMAANGNPCWGWVVFLAVVID